MMTENSSQSMEPTSSSNVTTPDVMPASTPAPETSSPVVQSAGSVTSPEVNTGAVADPTATPVVPTPYSPNYKFKAMGKDHEFEEWARGLVKDPETENKMRKLFEKAYGFDPMKEKYQKREADFGKKEEYYSTMDKVVGKVQHFMQNKDYDNLFGPSGLDLKFDDVVTWMNTKLEQMQLPPDQRAEFDRQAQIRQQNYLLAQENQYWQSQFGNQAVQARTMQLDSVLTRQDVSGLAQQWDQRVGKIGAFRETVIQEAINQWHASGQQQDLSAEQAVNLVMEKYGKLVGFGGQQAPQQPQGFSPQAQVQQPLTMQNAPQQQGQQQGPVIPHVAGRGTSPVKKAFKSLDDLKKHAQTLNN
jgi:hypothetical protein